MSRKIVFFLLPFISLLKSLIQIWMHCSFSFSEYPGLLENEDLFEVNSWIQEFRFTYLKQVCFITTVQVFWQNIKLKEESLTVQYTKIKALVCN